MLYYSLLNLGSNEFGPVNEMEMGFLVSTMIMSAIVNTIILGDVTALISQLSSSDNK